MDPDKSELDTAFVKAKKIFAKAEKLTVIKKKEPPKRTVINDPLTKEQREELRALVNEWVITANLVGRPLKHGHGTAFARLFDEAVNGEVNELVQIDKTEFEQCYAYLKQRIRATESYDSNRIIQRKSNFRSERITAIQTKCKQYGISDEKRKAYMKWRWNADSLTLLSDDELAECYSYAVSSPPPKWNIPKVEILGMHPMRERAFARWLDEKEAEAKTRGEDFDRQSIRIKGGKQKAIEELAERDRTLWTDEDGQPIDIEAFSKFLTKAKMGGFGGGRPRKPKT